MTVKDMREMLAQYPDDLELWEARYDEFGNASYQPRLDSVHIMPIVQTLGGWVLDYNRGTKAVAII